MKYFLLPLFFAVVFSSNAYAIDYHGAIAISPRGDMGWSYDFRTRAIAEYAALYKCGRNCSIAVWFKNGCGAIAFSRDGRGWAAGGGPTKASSEYAALKRCINTFGSCYVKRWVCTTRRYY